MESAPKRPQDINDIIGLRESLPEKASIPRSLELSVSPPRKRIRLVASEEKEAEERGVGARVETLKSYRSPFRLTQIRDSPPELNRDTVTLKDLLGDPLISECWNFNYLHDVDFLMGHFDSDVRHLVKVHVVHGFWKKEDPRRRALQEAAAQYSNVALHSAFLPEMFGTHHSKMLVVFRHDETAQVIIHTANMILRDWSNMTQGVWESPRLPLLQSAELDVGGSSVIGSGVRFKFDLLNYLRAYDTRRRTCKDLVDQLIRYDFSEVRGALVSSVPGRHKPGQNTETRFGWPALRSALKQLAVQNNRSDIVVQISSIATLGATDKWLRQTLFETLSCSQPGPPVPAPNFKVIFPTPDEIRRSLDGYVSGGSIHTKIRSPQQAKQLQYLMPIFHHWANDCPGGRAIPQGSLTREAGRRLAAPHIKTYIRYGKDGIDWALMTSANLSKQAWGEAANESGEVRLASYEIGVLQWPALYGETAKMIPAFRQDTLQPDTTDYEPSAVPLRIPYDLPLQRYESSERPWVATASYTTPDRLGQTWAAWS